MTKVLNINHSSRIIGGSDIYFRELTSLLRDNGYSTLEYYSAENELGMPIEIDLNNPSPVNLLKFFYNIEAKKKITPFLGDVDIAHIHIYYGKLTTSIIDALRKKNIPIVQTLHEYKLVCPVYTMFANGAYCDRCQGGRYYNAVLRLCNRGCFVRSVISMVEQYFSNFNGARTKINKFITVSDYQKEKLISMGVDSDLLVTIYNFISVKDYCPSYYIGNYFLFFGRVEEVKGILIILKALLFIKKNYGYEVPMRIVGDGSFKEQCITYCIENNLKNVQFYTFCSNNKIKKHINGAIASILPSLWGETFGLTILESLALKRTVIISNIGGMTEIIDNEYDGFIVEPYDYTALAEYMLLLYKNSSLAEKMGSRGREKVKLKFSRSIHLDNISKLYDEILK